MTPTFTSAFKKLNAEQKKAVTTIEGPVLVLAGPGTGKTQVLTLRIAEILQSTQMNPENILCLTYTDAAAKEMKSRLRFLIGATAYDVIITTFHGFTNSIIQEFPFKFGANENEETSYFTTLHQLDDLERLEIIDKLLDTGHWRFIRPLKKPLFYLQDIARLLQDMKRERIDPKELAKISQKLISKADPKKETTTISKLNRTIELAEFFRLYQKELATRQAYDYEDMINWVIDGFQNDPELALLYQERFQYILVDEYQDTNRSQLELLHQLTSFFKKDPNLFVVGDPNQSIYRFQGASTLNITEFLNRYPKAKTVSLVDNYRSSQIILDTARAVIRHNPDNQTFVQSDLKAVNDSKLKKSDLQITSYTNVDQEIETIVTKVKDQLTTGIPANEIAILVRKNAHINPFLEALDRAQIPSQATRGESALQNIYVERLLTLLELLDNPYDNVIFW